MESGTIYQLFGANGKTMVPIKRSGLKVGQVVSYGDMANPRHNAVVVEDIGRPHGQRCVFVDTLHTSHVSITSIEGPGGWELENDPPWTLEACRDLERKAGKMAQLEEENRRLKAALDARETERAKAAGQGKVPDFKAVIVAERIRDTSEIQSDYFGSTTEETILLAFSSTERDNFAEMRKAAATFEPTKHLGPGKDLYTVKVVSKTDYQENGYCQYKGSTSHWHSDICPFEGVEFETKAEAEAFIASKPKPESIRLQNGTVADFEFDIFVTPAEHREKWSMGHGYYLKTGHRYSDGWEVRKVKMSPEAVAVMIGKGQYRPGLI